jgi:hypothetical protein
MSNVWRELVGRMDKTPALPVRLHKIMLPTDVNYCTVPLWRFNLSMSSVEESGGKSPTLDCVRPKKECHHYWARARMQNQIWR